MGVVSWCGVLEGREPDEGVQRLVWGVVVWCVRETGA